MASRARFGARSRRSELLALLLGVASGLVMLLAAAEIRSRPEWAGKLALDEAARELAGAVEEEWAAMLRSAGFGARAQSTPGGPSWMTIRTSAWQEHRVVWGAEVDAARLEQVRVAIGTREPGAPDDPDAVAAFDALLTEARHQEIERRDLERAIGAITAALDHDVDPARRAQGRLRAVQLGLRTERNELVREQWTAAKRETEAAGGSLAASGLSGGISCALLTGRAVAEVLDEEERLELGEQLAEWWRAGKIGVLEGAVVERRATGLLEAEVQPELRVLLEQVVELAGGAAPGLRESVEARARLEAHVRWVEEGGVDAEVLLGQGVDGIRFLPRGDDLLTIRPRGALTHCFFHRERFLRGGLLIRLDKLASFGRGFHADLTGDETELGEQVRPWTELAGGQLGFLLRHEDPAAFIESEERRLGFLQIALVVMGLFTLLAGVVSFGGLRRQRRLQELKAGFIARVSHELRTPVTGILLATESLVEGRARTPERQERYFGLIQGEARRLERLVANVLDFSRLDRGEGPRLDREPVGAAELAEALRKVVEERRAAAQPRFESRVEVAEVEVNADVEALRRALVNLVENALAHAAASRITFEAETRGGELILALTDDGRGIEPALRERIFEPFRQGPPEEERGNGTPGAGLGLAIVREIVRGHDGRVSCEAGANGVGCRFELRLPLEEEQG